MSSLGPTSLELLGLAEAPYLYPVAAEYYRSLLPLAYADEENGWALLHYLAALGGATQGIDDLVRDTPEGPGWSALLDVDRAPLNALPWLGQWVGVTVDTTRSEEDQRQQIRDESGFRRGTPTAIVAAAQTTLTGTKTVMLLEREGGAYRLTAHTFTDETPDESLTRAALLTQKPAGIVLTYSTIPHWTWRTLRDSYDTWRDVRDAFATWQDVRDDTPVAGGTAKLRHTKSKFVTVASAGLVRVRARPAGASITTTATGALTTSQIIGIGASSSITAAVTAAIARLRARAAATTVHVAATGDLGTVQDMYWGGYLDASPYVHAYGTTYDGAHTWNSGPYSATNPGDTWDVFEAHAGKTISVINFGWGFRYGGFPTTLMNRIWARGAIPAVEIDWGAANTSPYDPSRFTNDEIVAGANDANWTAFFTAARDLGKPFFLMPTVEFNGSWQYEGGLASDGTFPGPNNPVNFREAWQHLKDLADSVGATNVTWCWVPNAINPTYLGVYDAILDYYPGDAYVDWTGMDTFNFAYPFGDFTANTQPTYDQIVSTVNPVKPMIIYSVAASSGPQDATDKAAWITGMFAGLPSFPLVKAFCWFNWWHADGGHHDVDIETPCTLPLPLPRSQKYLTAGMPAAQAFKAGIAASFYKPAFSAVPPFGKVPVP